jgi:UDP-glucose 4-epimerase
VAKLLVTGIAGGLAQHAAALLLEGGHEVVGVDYRPTPPLDGVFGGALAHVPVHQANYNKTAIEDVFRKGGFEGVVHLGRVGNLKESVGKRFDLNVVGSQKIMNLCRQHGVARLVVLSTFHIYGADAANHTPIAEDEPLRAGTQFPQIADAIQLDSQASRWVYESDGCSVVVLRPTNVIGPAIHNAMSSFLRQPAVPHVFGFDPMTQFLHEGDLARAIVLASTSTVRGIYNVAGVDAVPWRTAIRFARAHSYPVPSLLASLFLKVAPDQLPAYMLNFLKYPCVIADDRFREAFGWRPEIGAEETIWSTVEEVRQAQAGRAKAG